MSSKESKALIKDIRETIKLAKYGDAIHKCQVSWQMLENVLVSWTDIHCSDYWKVTRKIIWVTCCLALLIKVLTKLRRRNIWGSQLNILKAHPRLPCKDWRIVLQVKSFPWSMISLSISYRNASCICLSFVFSYSPCIFSEKSLDYYERLFGLATDAALSAVCLDIFKRRARNSADSNHAKIQEYLGRIWFSTEIEVSPEERELVRINKKKSNTRNSS